MLNFTHSLNQKIKEVSWHKKNWYFYHQLANWYSFKIPPNVPVFFCGDHPDILDKLQAHPQSTSCPIEEINSMIELKKQDSHIYDYFIFSQCIFQAYDIQELFERIQYISKPETRILIDTYQPLWEPLLWILQILKLKKPSSLKHWISSTDLYNFLYLAGFEVIKQEKFLLFPTYLPLVSYLLNILGRLPLVNRFCLLTTITARPTNIKKNDHSVSIIIPCKNERGNIQSVIQNCPQLGISTELMFIEGGSIDGTAEEIDRCIQKFPEKIIMHLTQTQKGKKQAVYQGIEKASGGIIMILDGDHTVPVQELKKFYEAIINNKGEFINGSRLVYGIETGAMRFLNMLANHFFARLFSWILNQPIKDTLCGTKVFFKKDFTHMMQGIQALGNFDPFGDFELLFGAATLNLKIIDMPVHYKARTYGQTQIRRFYHGFILLKMSLIALKFFKFRNK